MDKRSEWVGFNDFLTYLPTAQSQDNEHLLDKTGIQQMDAGGKRYYFDFTSVCRKGERSSAGGCGGQHTPHTDHAAAQ
ncbi:MAG: hypothetical protein L6V80_03500 [Bacteroidales bacterium]|nr:MAG: hypothetical protein L6V80_03500 [Bacteroidales bacterium]